MDLMNCILLLFLTTFTIATGEFKNATNEILTFKNAI